MKEKTVEFFTRNFDAKKVVVYQNINYFLIPTLFYESVNPTHNIIAYAKRKKKWRSGSNNHQKVALILKSYNMVFLPMTIILALIGMISFTDVIYNGCMLIFLFGLFVMLHEVFHLIGFYAMNIPVRIKLLKSGVLPYAIGLYSSYYDKPFNSLPKEKKVSYFKIAIIPYLFIFPLSVYFMASGITILFILGMSLIFCHIANLPLEFLTVVEDNDS